MLKSVVIKGLSLAQNRSITLPFRDLSQGPYFVSKVGGLEPVKADINSTSYPDMDMDTFQSARVGGRNLTITVALNPRPALGESVQSLRRTLYKILPPKTPVRVTLNDDEMAQTYIDGYVEAVAPSIFDKNTDLTISIVSMNAYLTSTTQIKNQGYKTNTDNNIKYDGDAPAPWQMSLTFVRASSYASFLVNKTELLRVTYAFNVGDVLNINTTPRSKSITRTRSGSTISLLDQITTGALDLYFDAATDQFRVNTSSGSTAGNERFLLTYAAKYVGV